MLELKGITWDHKRGFNPLVITAERFENIYPDVSISWDKRSLKDFGDYPVDELADKYDLLLIDHPFIAEASKKDIFLNFNDFLSKNELEKVKKNSVGRTFYTYTYNDKVLALPVDAAAIVSAVKKDWFVTHEEEIPDTLDKVIEFGKKYPNKVIIPLCPTDIWCVFLSLCAVSTDGIFIDLKDGIDVHIAAKQIDNIYKLVEISAGNPFELNPINVLDLIANEDEYCYTPYIFGYVNYSIAGEYKNVVTFYDVPLEKKGSTASLLGGVGVAVSKKCRLPEIAVKYASYIASPDIQANQYFEGGGQPAGKTAWLSPKINRISNNFFANTLETIENAYVRPRFIGWNIFQEEASKLLCCEVSRGSNSKDIAKKLNDLFSNHFNSNGNRR